MDSHKIDLTKMDREHLLWIRNNTTADQRMNWPVDAMNFVRESRKNWKKEERKQ